MKLIIFALFVFSAMTVSYGQDVVTVGTETANIRSAPNGKASVIKTAKQGDALDVVEHRGAWNKVKVGKSFGWIHGNALETPSLKLPATYSPFGDPNSRFEVYSNGPGTGTGTGRGVGTGTGKGVGNGDTAKQTKQDDPKTDELTPLNSPFRILSKPNATYTETARRNQVNGTVRLRIEFLSTGEIGEIVPITELPDGLTDQAIAAAKGIRFQPQRVNGVAKTTKKIVEYSFAIY